MTSVNRAAKVAKRHYMDVYELPDGTIKLTAVVDTDEVKPVVDEYADAHF